MAHLKILVALLLIAAHAEAQRKPPESYLLGSEDVVDKKSNIYQVVITQKWFLSKEYYVGIGALIDNFWVITSAEVAKHIESRWYNFWWWTPKVKAGMRRLNSNAVQEIGVEKVIKHEFYKGVSTDNDIALVKLAKPGLIFNEYVGSVTLPEDSQDPPSEGNEVIVTGWLTTGKDKKPLQQLAVNVMDKASCAKEYAVEEKNIDETLFCVVDQQREKAVCDADVGSPAVIDDTVLVGIFTMAHKPGKNEMCSTKPALFTNIAYYTSWIKANMN